MFLKYILEPLFCRLSEPNGSQHSLKKKKCDLFNWDYPFSLEFQVGLVI